MEVKNVSVAIEVRLDKGSVDLVPSTIGNQIYMMFNDSELADNIQKVLNLCLPNLRPGDSFELGELTVDFDKQTEELTVRVER